MIRPRNLKGGSRSLDPYVNTMGRRPYFNSHVRRWVNVPLDLAWSLGAICAHYRCRVFYCVHDLSPCEKGNSRLTKLLGWLTYETIQRYNNHLLTWGQDGRHNIFPPLDFLGSDTAMLPAAIVCSLWDGAWPLIKYNGSTLEDTKGIR